MLERVPETAPTRPQEADSPPANAGSETQGNTYLLQQNYNTVNAWQENHLTAQTVMQLAELRHQEVINSVTSATKQNHHSGVAQLRGEAIITLQTQAREHEDEQQRLRQDSTLRAEEIANYMSAKQTAESQQAHAVVAEMQQREHFKEEELQRMMQALRVAESARVASETARVAAEQALEQQRAERLQLVATAYSTGAQHAAPALGSREFPMKYSLLRLV